MAWAGLAAAQAPAPDLSRATELDNAATKEMADGKFDDAARDYLAAFEITKDPAVFFKIAGAYEKAGKCDEAVTYYKRYLEEAKPEQKLVDVTTEHMAACAKPAEVTPPPEPAPAPAPAPPAEKKPAEPSPTKNAAWLFVGGSLAFVTAGVVLAYSSSSSEQDIKDLYVSSNGGPPVFDASTQKRYDDLIAEGKTYQYLSWTSFGIATGCAVAAAILFWRDAKDDDRVSVVPVLAPHHTGVAATIHF